MTYPITIPLPSFLKFQFLLNFPDSSFKFVATDVVVKLPKIWSSIFLSQFFFQISHLSCWFIFPVFFFSSQKSISGQVTNRLYFGSSSLLWHLQCWTPMFFCCIWFLLCIFLPCFKQFSSCHVLLSEVWRVSLTCSILWLSPPLVVSTVSFFCHEMIMVNGY